MAGLGPFLEYLDILDALTDPTQHGGTPDDAFHVVLPALPGFGFSGKPRDTGTGVPKIATLWETLMGRLNYRNSTLTVVIGALSLRKQSSYKRKPPAPRGTARYRLCCRMRQPWLSRSPLSSMRLNPSSFITIGTRVIQSSRVHGRKHWGMASPIHPRANGVDRGKICLLDGLRAKRHPSS